MTRRQTLLFVGAAAALLLLVHPTDAAAGFTFELGVGVNGVTDDEYAGALDVDPIVGISVAGLFRPIQYFSAGVLLHYGFLNASGEGLEDEYAGFLGVLAEARAHVPVWRVEPWVGFGLGYATAHVHSRGQIGGFGEGEGTASLHGLGIDLALGVLFNITDTLNLGAYFRMIFGVYPTVCYRYEIDTVLGDTEEHDCEDTEDYYADEPDDMPHLWVVGLNMTNTF